MPLNTGTIICFHQQTALGRVGSNANNFGIWDGASIVEIRSVSNPPKPLSKPNASTRPHWEEPKYTLKKPRISVYYSRYSQNVLLDPCWNPPGSGPQPMQKKAAKALEKLAVAMNKNTNSIQELEKFQKDQNRGWRETHGKIVDVWERQNVACEEDRKRTEDAEQKSEQRYTALLSALSAWFRHWVRWLHLEHLTARGVKFSRARGILLYASLDRLFIMFYAS